MIASKCSIVCLNNIFRRSRSTRILMLQNSDWWVIKPRTKSPGCIVVSSKIVVRQGLPWSALSVGEECAGPGIHITLRIRWRIFLRNEDSFFCCPLPAKPWEFTLLCFNTRKVCVNSTIVCSRCFKYLQSQLLTKPLGCTVMDTHSSRTRTEFAGSTTTVTKSLFLQQSGALKVHRYRYALHQAKSYWWVSSLSNHRD